MSSQPVIGNADFPQDLYLARGAELVGEPEVDETAEVRWVPVDETPAIDFVRVLRHQLFVTPTAPVSSARSMFASLDTTPAEAGQRGANLGRWPPLVGAPWILTLWAESVLASIQPRWTPQLVSNEASKWCHYSRT